MWHIPEYIDPGSVDRTWQPPETSTKPYIYHFLSQHTNTDSKRVSVGVSGVTYTVPGAVENQIVFDSRVHAIPVMHRWTVPDYIDKNSIDFTWHPNAFDPPYIYHFASQWQSSSGVIYTVPGATEIKFVNDFTVESTPQIKNWSVPDNIDVSTFDFSWHPNAFDPPFIYHFASQWHPSSGVTYTVPGATEIKFVNDFTVKSIPKMESWIVPDNIDVSTFDFSWHPNALEPPYEYRFPTQHQRDGGPIYKGSAGIKYCSQQNVKAGSTQIFYMDFLNPESAEQFQQLQKIYPDIKKTRYVDSHLNVFKRIISLATTEFIWIISSICDYRNFDFSWHPDSSQREMIHCFASGNQKRGDTFYINVASFKNQLYTLAVLDWFNVINYVKNISVLRFEWPVHSYTSDNLVQEIKNYQFNSPYAVFTNQKECYPYFYPCLWSEKDRVVESFSTSKSICSVPRDAKAYIKKQIYDYPHISNNDNKSYFAEQPLDIIFISNGEPNEQDHWDHLINNTQAKKYPGNVHWVKGINGRNIAYKEAARQSTTPWFFAVFAKLRVNSDFNFQWQPDYFQEPKHYIFHALNPLNGLVYGHQAIIAKNKKLTLEATETGLDFTLSTAHEVVPILSGVAEFNRDPWMTWRTAFREVLKLKYFSVTKPNIETEYRLKKWLSMPQGQYAEYCLQGARDAVEYYESVNGDYEKIKLSYEWMWVREYFNARYSLK